MHRELRNGRDDGLEPLAPMDLRSVRGFPDLLERMSKTAFGGRELGEAYEVLLSMARDDSCAVIVTVSGAMTVAKMGMVLIEMIEAGLADMIVSTGALMAHGLSEDLGALHYKHDPLVGDRILHERGYNRVYDTLEMEANLWDAERFVSDVLSDLDLRQPTCSFEINREIGRRLAERGRMPSILGCAYRRGVPIYVPAFTDSELGLDIANHMIEDGYRRNRASDLDSLLAVLPAFNPYMDLFDFVQRLMEASTLGIFTIGGGVPRNWGQQVGPFVESINLRLGLDLPVPRIRYGVRICPEPEHWGGLSGCTYAEGVSWGKFIPPDRGGRFAEVHCDATIAWPLLTRAVLDRLSESTP